MKRRLVLLLAFLLPFGLLACSKPSEPEPSPELPQPLPNVSGPSLPEMEFRQLLLATGSPGGTYDSLGGAIATSWNKNLADSYITVSSLPSGGSIDNLMLLHDGETDIGFVINSIAEAAWNGSAPFEGQAFQDFRAIGTVYPEVFQVAVHQDAGAASLEDLRGKSIAIGPEGSGSAIIAWSVFQAAGIDLETETDVRQDAFADAINKMLSGEIDACSGVLSVPASAITDLDKNGDIALISLSDSVLDSLLAGQPLYSRFSIPGGTYSNTDDVTTISCQAVLYCRADLDEDLAYQLTKSLFIHSSELAQATPAGQYVLQEHALDGITTPLHPGSAAYYRECGISIPNELLAP